MRDIDQQLQNLCASDCTNLCFAIRFYLRTGETLRFGTANVDFEIPGDGTYLSRPGIQVGSITHYANGTASTCDVELPVDYNSPITRDDIRNRRINGAKIEIDVIDVVNLSVPGMRIMTGEVGGINYTDGGLCSFAVVGDWDTASYISTWTYGPDCRNRLGDKWCKVPIFPNDVLRSTSYSTGDYVRVLTGAAPTGYANRMYRATTAGVTAAVSPVFDTTVGGQTVDGDIIWEAEQSWVREGEVTLKINNRRYDVTYNESRASDGWFDGGVAIVYTSTNIPHINEVRIHVGMNIAFWLPPKLPIVAGDKFLIFPGCNKTPDHCANKFKNFRPNGGLGIQAFMHAPDETYAWQGYEEPEESA